MCWEVETPGRRRSSGNCRNDGPERGICLAGGCVEGCGVGSAGGGIGGLFQALLRDGLLQRLGASFFQGSQRVID